MSLGTKWTYKYLLRLKFLQIYSGLNLKIFVPRIGECRNYCKKSGEWKIGIFFVTYWTSKTWILNWDSPIPTYPKIGTTLSLAYKKIVALFKKLIYSIWCKTSIKIFIILHVFYSYKQLFDCSIKSSTITYGYSLIKNGFFYNTIRCIEQKHHLQRSSQQKHCLMAFKTKNTI